MERQTSRDRVTSTLQRNGPMSRADIARSLSLSRATVPSGARGGHTGRPPLLVRLNPSAGAALGIDFGKRHLRVATADLGHRVLAERTVEMDPDHEASRGMEIAAELVTEVLEEAAL